MTVHIVFTERGTIYSVRENKSDAIKDRDQIEKLYGSATIKTFEVR